MVGEECRSRWISVGAVCWVRSKGASLMTCHPEGSRLPIPTGAGSLLSCALGVPAGPRAGLWVSADMTVSPHQVPQAGMGVLSPRGRPEPQELMPPPMEMSGRIHPLDSGTHKQCWTHGRCSINSRYFNHGVCEVGKSTGFPPTGAVVRMSHNQAKGIFDSTFILMVPKDLHSGPYYGCFCCGAVPFPSALALC